MRLRVQVTDVHRKSRKNKVTSLVMKFFLGFLGASRNGAIIVFSLSGFGIKPKKKPIQSWMGSINAIFLFCPVSFCRWK